jgi:HK97 family phage major capsid protein
LTEEEKGKCDELISKQEELRGNIEREQTIVEAERQAAETEMRGKDAAKDAKKDETRAVSPRGTEEYRASFAKFLAAGEKSLTEQEVRALQSDSDTAGGYMVASEQFISTLISAIDNKVFIRGLATKFNVPSAQSLGAASLDNNPADADWTAEILTGSEDGAMSFGKRELTPHPLAKLIKISRKLLRQLGGAEALVRDRLAYKFAVSEEQAFMTGSGSNQPLGVFTASTNGISTSRDISTGNTTTAMTLDGLTRAKYSLKQDYLANSQWVFHRDAILQLALIKDGNGQYIWRESVRVGEPDRLLNIPINMSEYAPNTFTSQLYVGILGDFSYYWIADALNMQIQALFELYAATNQVGYIGRMETDAMPVLGEAFARVKLA